MTNDSSGQFSQSFRRRVADRIVGSAPTSRRRSRFDRLASPHADSSLPEAVIGVALAVALLLTMLWGCLNWENPALRALAVLGSVLQALVVVRAAIVVSRN